jgi:hypothetical protein
MPAHSVNEVIEKLAKHPEGFPALFARMGYVPLLPLLELPHRTVVQQLGKSFHDFGLSDANFAAVSMRALVVCALRSESSYWAGLAVHWLADGFPIDAELVSAGDDMIQAKRGTQSDRHTLFRLIRRYKPSA